MSDKNGVGAAWSAYRMLTYETLAARKPAVLGYHFAFSPSPQNMLGRARGLSRAVHLPLCRKDGNVYYNVEERCLICEIPSGCILRHQKPEQVKTKRKARQEKEPFLL